MTNKERGQRRVIAVEAALNKINSDMAWTAPEARNLLLEKIERRLDCMADWLMPDDGEFEEL